MKRCLVLCLALLAALLTGCPRNQYIVELTPHGDALERRLTFYRENGTDTNGVPVYQDFPEAELATIKTLYPPGSVKANGKRHIARAEFTGAMPKDVGGAGNWTNLTTTLGKGTMYAERFRGNDDLATAAGKRLEAVDQLTDLLIGWSRQELGKEPQYENLRKFLDVDFRRDLKNLSLYHWVGGMSASFNPKAQEEFAVRFGQYLVERGYLKVGQLPEWFAVISRNDKRGWSPLIQRLIADKMGLPLSKPFPSSFAFLADEDAVETSFAKFLVTSDAYRNRLKRWEDAKQTNPDIKQPEPSDMIEELLLTQLDFRLFSTDDHLEVKLSLPSQPVHTNGKWDAVHKQVLWESSLDEKEQASRLPVFCYASWAAPDEILQKEHFGSIILTGENLLQYCLWRASLNAKHAEEWEAMLAGLKADVSVAGILDAFRFSDEPVEPAAKEGGKDHLASEFPRELLKSALAKTPQADTK